MTATATPPLSAAGHLNITELARGFPEPDDLYRGSDGTIYVSDTTEGTVSRLGKDGTREIVARGFRSPEGIVQLPDMTLVVAEQCTDRLIRLNLATGQANTFLQLKNPTSDPGIDGIALDTHVPGAPSIIVPDSPNGTILQVSPDGKTIKQIASGFVRPTGAWAEPDGSILIVDEHGDSLDRLHPDGSLEKLAALSFPDDVIEDNSGNILVSTLGDNAIHLITSGTHEDELFTVKLGNPQGIVFDTDGNLIVTDPGNHRLLKLVIH